MLEPEQEREIANQLLLACHKIKARTQLLESQNVVEVHLSREIAEARQTHEAAVG